MSMLNAEGIKGKWKQQMGAAKIAWGKLTEDELLKAEGHSEKLAGLVQERYAITRDEADTQVKSFFDKHMPSVPSAGQIKGVWKQKVGAAKIAWGKLTEDELLKIEGHEQKLSGLVQERYAITRVEADKQVKEFFDKHQS